LVEFHLEDVDPRAHGRDQPALALPRTRSHLAELPVLEALSATHLIADLTLSLGKVVHVI
jgi:acetoacetate decarboxylase